MVPRESGRGSSFKGAGMYYLHDKHAETSERVAFTHTENIPTEDPEKALKWMAWTAIHAEELKRQSGSRMTGRPCTKPVFSFSLAWHPEQQPEKWQMIAAGRQALFALDLQDHEALMVAHNDCDHSHLHILANLIDPNTGRAKRLSFSRLKLSKWAEEYEREQGKIYCEQRVENNERREQGQFVKYEEPELDLKAKVTDLYFHCDSGKAFSSALAEHGLKLAQGKRIVILDAKGNIHSLTRQIEGASAKDIRAKLGDLELPDVDSVREQGSGGTNEPVEPDSPQPPRVPIKDEDYFDRDQADRDWQESIIDAAIQEETPAQRVPKQTSQKGETVPPSGDLKRPSQNLRKPTNSKANLENRPNAPTRPDRKVPVSPSLLNRLQDKQLAELGSFYTENTNARLSLAVRLDNQYGAHERELRREIAQLEEVLNNSGRVRLWWLKVTRQIPRNAEEHLFSTRQTLENIQWRRSEAEGALEGRIREQRREIESRHELEHLEIRPQPTVDQDRREPPMSTMPQEDTDYDSGPSFEQ